MFTYFLYWDLYAPTNRVYNGFGVKWNIVLNICHCAQQKILNDLPTASCKKSISSVRLPYWWSFNTHTHTRTRTHTELGKPIWFWWTLFGPQVAPLSFIKLGNHSIYWSILRHTVRHGAVTLLHGSVMFWYNRRHSSCHGCCSCTPISVSLEHQNLM